MEAETKVKFFREYDLIFIAKTREELQGLFCHQVDIDNTLAILNFLYLRFRTFFFFFFVFVWSGQFL